MGPEWRGRVGQLPSVGRVGEGRRAASLPIAPYYSLVAVTVAITTASAMALLLPLPLLPVRLATSVLFGLSSPLISLCLLLVLLLRGSSFLVIIVIKQCAVAVDAFHLANPRRIVGTVTKALKLIQSGNCGATFLLLAFFRGDAANAVGSSPFRLLLLLLTQ